MEEQRSEEVLERIREKLRRARDPGEKASPPSHREILRERARALALPPSTAGKEGETLAVIEFCLGRERFAVESRWVREVFVLPHLVRVPCTPPFIAGVVNLRGAIVSVVDLRRVLGVGEEEEKMENVLLLCGEGMEFGLMAQRVLGAREHPMESLSPPLTTLPDAALRFQRGVLPGPVSFLDAPLLLTSPEMRVGGSASSP